MEEPLFFCLVKEQRLKAEICVLVWNVFLVGSSRGCIVNIYLLVSASRIIRCALPSYLQ